MSKLSKKALFFALFLCPFLPVRQALAQSLKSQRRWEISASIYERQLQQKGFSDLDHQTDSLILGALDQNTSYEDWALEVRPELRILHSRSLRTSENDISRISITDLSRNMDLHSQLSPAKNSRDSEYLVIADIEKLNFRYQGKQLEFILGRNPFNPGIMRLAPVWNKFGKDVFYAGYPNLSFNPDMSSLKFTTGSFWIQNANVYTRTEEKNAYLFIAGLNLDSLEIQVLGGQFWNEPAYGANLSLSTAESLIKAEVISFEAAKKEQAKHTQAALGYETSWTDSFSTISEILYSSLPSRFQNPDQITLGASPYTKLRSEYYLANQFDYQFSATWIGSFLSVINLKDSSHIMNLSLKGNLSDNFEMSFNGRLGLGQEGREFSSQSVTFINGNYLGYNSTASLTAKYFF